MENSKYYPIIDAMLKAKMLNHNGKIIGYVKNNKEFNTAEKLIKKINESLDGVLCNYEAFENPVNKDDLYKHDWVKAGAVGFNFRCCEGKLRLYLNDENEKEDNATFLLSTKKDCIDDLCDAQRVRNAMRQGIIDYAVAYPDNAEVQTSIEMCMKYIGEAN